MSTADVTTLLVRWQKGDQCALDELTPVVYRELRQIAAGFLKRERKGHTLQSTALVHEAYVRLIDRQDIAWQTRSHFFAVASNLFRRILVDHARKRSRQKRGGGAECIVLDEQWAAAAPRGMNLLRLDDALQALSVMDPRQSRIVEMKFFGGLEIEEIAEVLGISQATVKRDWATARAWLLREMGGEIQNRP